MQLFVLIGIIILIYFWKKEKLENNEQIICNDTNDVKDNKKNFKKIIYIILFSFPLFIMYYFIVGVISTVIIYIITNAAEGAWGLGILLGLILSPVLTVITDKKILEKMN